MNNRTIAAVFAVCLASSLALADSPTDAPLMPDDAKVASVERNKITNQHGARPKAKNQSSSRENKPDNSAKNKERRNIEQHEPGNASEPSDQALSPSL